VDKIEHFAVVVKDPPAVAGWYAEHLGFTIKRAMDTAPFGHFLADASGGVMLELYNNPAVTVPDYASMDPLVLHIAFCSDDVAADYERLIAAGASGVDAPTDLPTGDTVAMLRDPWGLAIQLVKRAEPMV